MYVYFRRKNENLLLKVVQSLTLVWDESAPASSLYEFPGAFVTRTDLREKLLKIAAASMNAFENAAPPVFMDCFSNNLGFAARLKWGDNEVNGKYRPTTSSGPFGSMKSFSIECNQLTEQYPILEKVKFRLFAMWEKGWPVFELRHKW